MASKLKTQEVILQSPNGLVEKTVTVDNSGVVTIDGVNPMEKTLFKEYVVTGSPVTSINFSDLDINTHKSYRIECEFQNATATDSKIYMYVNGDTTASNYYSQYIYGGGTGLSADRYNFPDVGGLTGSSLNSSTIFLKVNNNYPRAEVLNDRATASAVTLVLYAWAKTATVTNISQLTFTSTVASAIGVGSKIRIYRGDL